MIPLGKKKKIAIAVIVMQTLMLSQPSSAVIYSRCGFFSHAIFVD